MTERRSVHSVFGINVNFLTELKRHLNCVVKVFPMLEFILHLFQITFKTFIFYLELFDKLH